MSGGKIVSEEFYDNTNEFMDVFFRFGSNRDQRHEDDEEYDHRDDPNEDEEKVLVRKTSSLQRWVESLE